MTETLIILIPIISLLGIVIGVTLKKLAKEEIKFGKFGARYFIWMKRIILLLIILVLIYFNQNIPILILTIIIGFIIAIFISEYFFLGLALVFGFLNSKESLILLSSLVFLFGLPYGSILRRFKKEHLYVIPLFFLPFLILVTNINQDILIGLGAGGCFNYIIRK